MVVIALEQRLRRSPPRRVALRLPGRIPLAAGRLPLSTYAQGRTLQRAVTETLVTVAVLAAAIAALLLAQSWLGALV
jgi:hypothetical protein